MDASCAWSIKAELDRSFIKEERKGGYGGVIRDRTGQILCCYSGPVECTDSNGAEVFAMPMGCRELQKMGGLNAIIEGDSFSTIQ